MPRPLSLNGFCLWYQKCLFFRASLTICITSSSVFLPKMLRLYKVTCFSDIYNYFMILVISNVSYEIYYVNTWYPDYTMIILTEILHKVYRCKNVNMYFRMDSYIDVCFLTTWGTEVSCAQTSMLLSQLKSSFLWIN